MSQDDHMGFRYVILFPLQLFRSRHYNIALSNTNVNIVLLIITFYNWPEI